MITIQASRNELHNLLERPQLAGIPILVKYCFSGDDSGDGDISGGDTGDSAW